jgi:hypothetical protein
LGKEKEGEREKSQSHQRRQRGRWRKRTKRIDPPDRSLDEDLVLVQHDQASQRPRRQLLEQDRVRRPVSLKHLTLQQRLVLAPLLPKFLRDRGLVLSEREGFGLGEEVGEEDLVVEVGTDGVLGFDRGEEVGGDELGALVDELVEGVLTYIGTGQRKEGEEEERSTNRSCPTVPK